MPLEYVFSEKGKKKLLDSGHLYVKDRSNDDYVYWKCEKSATFN